QIFDRMMAHRSGDIEIWIGVMQRVKAPEPRHRVLTAMRGVMQEIEQQKSHHKAQPLLGQGPRGQSHAKCAFKLRSECIQRSESEAGEDDVEEPDAKVAEPPTQRREFPLPPRLTEFPQGDREQAAN